VNLILLKFILLLKCEYWPRGIFRAPGGAPLVSKAAVGSSSEGRANPSEGSMSH